MKKILLLFTTLAYISFFSWAMEGPHKQESRSVTIPKQPTDITISFTDYSGKEAEVIIPANITSQFKTLQNLTEDAEQEGGLQEIIPLTPSFSHEAFKNVIDLAKKTVANANNSSFNIKQDIMSRFKGEGLEDFIFLIGKELAATYYLDHSALTSAYLQNLEDFITLPPSLETRYARAKLIAEFFEKINPNLAIAVADQINIEKCAEELWDNHPIANLSQNDKEIYEYLIKSKIDNHSAENAAKTLLANPDPKFRNIISIREKQGEETLTQTLTISSPSEKIKFIRLSPDGQFLAALTHNGIVYIWKKELPNIWKQVQKLKSEEDNGDLRVLTFSPDGQLLIGGDFNHLYIWQQNSQNSDSLWNPYQTIKQCTKGIIRSIAINSDAKLLGVVGIAGDLSLYSWNTTTHTFIESKKWPFLLHSNVKPLAAFNNLAFSTDDKFLITMGKPMETSRKISTLYIQPVSTDPKIREFLGPQKVDLLTATAIWSYCQAEDKANFPWQEFPKAVSVIAIYPTSIQDLLGLRKLILKKEMEEAPEEEKEQD